MFHNSRITVDSLKSIKNYATEENAVKAVKKALPDEDQYSFLVIVSNNRHVPMIKWKTPFEHNIFVSIQHGFYTFN